MVPSRCLSLAVGLLLVAIPNPAFSDSVFDPVTDSDPDPNDENAPQDGHLHGCMLFLNEDHTPQEPLVGKDFEAITISGYKVEDEAGPTAASCTDGRAGGYPCNNIDLMSVMELSELDGETSADLQMANDIWGWNHSGREFAIVGLGSGTAFVEITDPYNPVLVGKLPARNNAYSSWRDIKTCQDHAYIVTEAKQGMQIFDLKRLLNATPTTTFDADAIYDEFENAHNIFINEETKTAYVVGSNTCNGGLHIIDLTLPLAPSFEKCFADDGYTHDVQCVNYSGPDADYEGKEICIACNENSVTIIDQSTGTKLSRVVYDDDHYTHQGWLTEDHKFFIFNDELDEYRLGGKTRTHVLDVTELSKPSYVGYYEGRTAAIDHNNYVLNDQVYQAHYEAGLNILKIVDPSQMKFEEEAFFDIYPDTDENAFHGAWSNYPYLPSGNIIVSGIEEGLFVLKQTSPEITDAPTFPPTPETTGDSPPCINSPNKALMKMAGDGSKILLSCDAIDVSFAPTSCQPNGKLATHCPVSCGTCDSEIYADSTAPFLFDAGTGKIKRCKWIAGKPPKNREKICARNKSLRMTCRASCNYATV